VNPTSTPTAPQDVLAAWRRLTDENPRLRERDAAKLLGLPEAALVASLPPDRCTPLAPKWGDLFKGIEAIGRVTAITRNESAIHEKHGVYRNVEMERHMGVVHDPEIDLRLFPHAMGEAYAVTKDTAHGPRKSIQIFDDRGDAAHKIWCTESSDLAAFDALVASLADPDPTPPVREIATPEPEPTAPSQLDVEGFRDGWRTLKDTHDFYPLIRRYGVDRLQALTLAPEGMATQVPVDTLERLLNAVAENGTSIMVFVGNRAMIQIHTGPVETISAGGPWLNVLDAGFNLHVRRDRIASCWLVIKPTDDGPVHSLELFDSERGMILQMFGERKPGKAELPEWVETLKRVSQPAAGVPEYESESA
jgi:putative hemin transport protein